jgi:hypothetical protein
MNKQTSFKTAKARIWIVDGKEYTNKREAYRVCRSLNGKKAGGDKPYNVQRKNA